MEGGEQVWRDVEDRRAKKEGREDCICKYSHLNNDGQSGMNKTEVIKCTLDGHFLSIINQKYGANCPSLSYLLFLFRIFTFRGFVFSLPVPADKRITRN